MWIARFVKIFDCCFVNQGADSAIAHLDSVGVVPLDGAFDAVSAFQHENHEGLGVHLFLQIKGLCMGSFRRVRWPPADADGSTTAYRAVDKTGDPLHLLEDWAE